MDDIISQITPKFNKVLDVVRSDLATVRTGKASPQLIENLAVEAYGGKMKLLELAAIHASDPTTLLITPFDIANVETIIKAIQEENLGLTVIPEDTHIRVVVPSLSQERREEYVKLIKTKIEGGKVMIRQVRHEAMEDISKSDLDEDTQRHLEKEVQELTDKMVEKLDFLATEKEKELLTT